MTNDSNPHCVLIFDKSAKGRGLLRSLQGADSGFQEMFLTPGVQKWEASEDPYLLRWFTFGVLSGQTMMSSDLSVLLDEAMPLAVENINAKKGIQLLIAVEDAELEDIIEARFRDLTAE
ncbi:hypothetical protein [Paraburkholderia sp. J8-2]|uniref:hypothetical protein n=1 Tax=Paraburkholderia sp. J8-2 TaxID=2805440 RepID=UPI002AB7EFD5|nr:hypothetical protein [Paraburkholderia sp. J8-2]